MEPIFRVLLAPMAPVWILEIKYVLALQNAWMTTQPVFSAYTCGFGNEFVCKSEYEDLVNEYDDLVRRHNDLVDELARLQRKQSDVESCISYSSSLDEAQNCIW